MARLTAYIPGIDYVYMATNTALLTVKTDKKLKQAAQKVAAELGLPLSAIVNNYLRQIVREPRITFETPLVPNEKTARSLERAHKDYLAGKNIDGPFTSAKEAIAFLETI